MILDGFKFPLPADFEPSDSSDNTRKVKALCLAMQIVHELATSGYRGDSALVQVCVYGRVTKHSPIGRMLSRIIEKRRGWKVVRAVPVLGNHTIIDLKPAVRRKHGSARRLAVRD